MGEPLRQPLRQPTAAVGEADGRSARFGTLQGAFGVEVVEGVEGFIQQKEPHSAPPGVFLDVSHQHV